MLIFILSPVLPSLLTVSISKPVIEGLDAKSVDIGKIAAQLKAFCACGGTAKNNQILLQGDHREKTKEKLIALGFSEENIEIQ